MSTFFGDQLRRRSLIVRYGFEERRASVMRLRAIAPSRSFDGLAGASVGHQATTGASASSGITSVSGWCTSPPRGCSTMISPAPASAPKRTWASRFEFSKASASSAGSAFSGVSTGLRLGLIAITRQGCSRLAAFASSREYSSSSSFVEMSRVSTRPVADSPRSSCSSSILREISRVRVLGISMIMASSIGGRRGPASRRLPRGPTCRNGTAAAGRASTRTPRSGRGSPSSAPPRG